MRFLFAEAKLAYLLGEPGKSAFFLKIGYSLANAAVLRLDILDLAATSPRTLYKQAAFSTLYEITGTITAPNGRDYSVRTGWSVLPAAPDDMNFVTAYPARRRG
jgi:hypothetical protein